MREHERGPHERQRNGGFSKWITWYHQSELHHQQVLTLMWRVAQLEAWITSLPSDIVTSAPEPLRWTPDMATPRGAPDDAICEPGDVLSGKVASSVVDFGNFTVEVT